MAVQPCPPELYGNIATTWSVPLKRCIVPLRGVGGGVLLYCTCEQCTNCPDYSPGYFFKACMEDAVLR